MDSRDFEFVKADVQEDDVGVGVNIKNEPFDAMLMAEVKHFEGGSGNDSDDVGKSKCGEIFSISCGSYILICAFCNAEFENMGAFGGHMREKHDGDGAVTNSPGPSATAPAVMHLPWEKSEEPYTNDDISGVPFYHEVPPVLVEGKPDVSMIDVVAKQDDFMTQSDDDFGDDDHDDDSFKAPSDASSEEGSDYEDGAKGDKEKGRSLKCDTCNRKYKNRRTLYRHQKNKGCSQEPKMVNPELFCTLCNRQLKTKRTFLRHKKTHESNLKQEPDDSGAESKSKSEPPQDPNLFCEICIRYFKNRSNLMTHAERHNTIPLALQGDPEYLKCKFCDEQFDELSTRKTHEKTHSGDHPYSCSVCNKSFATIYKKNVHAALHTNKRPHQCPQCPNAYLTKRDVLRHITYRHLNVRPFKCDFCDKTCFRKTELAIHMRRHTGEKPYVCEDCGNSFAALSQLKSHQLRHTQTKNFKCEQCGRLFYSSTSLKDHQASHSDAKPFGCEICGRRFPRAKALKKHKKLHSDVKAYVCNICGKAYAQDSGLYAHKKSHGLFSNPQGTQFSVPLT